MIAKIGKGNNLYGALVYNHTKVEQGNGSVLHLNNIPETLNNSYSAAYFNRCFEPYLLSNIKTEKTVRHISLNPDPKDKLSEDKLALLAQEYMDRMGYGNQPYVVFKHDDIARSHIHIVTTCVDLKGRKIRNDYDHHKSMAICRDLEKKYHLIPATEKQKVDNRELFQPVDYKGTDIKSQIASVVRYLPKFYKFQNLGTYNALLSLFNITVEQVSGQWNGQPKNGLVYFALNGNGTKASNPFKASLFGKYAGLESLQNHFLQSKELMKTDASKSILKNTIEIAKHTSAGEGDFKQQLVDQGINTVVRRNEDGRIYGITFIDHESRNVWNGSQLGKNLSANVFNDAWKEEIIEKPQQITNTDVLVTSKMFEDEKAEVHELFDFLNNKEPQEANDFGLISALGNLLPEVQEEDFEELAFTNRMKKKKRKKNF